MLVICKYVIAHAIAYFATYFSSYIYGIFRTAYAKIMLHMLHMQKFAYIRMYVVYFRICDLIFQHFPCPTLF